MKLATALVIAGLGAGLLGGVWAHGRHHGVLACEARVVAARQRVERDLFRSADELSRRALAFEETLTEQRSRAMEVEDEARANPDVCRLPGPDSLHRLERRWTAH